MASEIIDFSLKKMVVKNYKISLLLIATFSLTGYAISSLKSFTYLHVTMNVATEAPHSALDPRSKSQLDWLNALGANPSRVFNAFSAIGATISRDSIVFKGVRKIPTVELGRDDRGQPVEASFSLPPHSSFTTEQLLQVLNSLVDTYNADLLKGELAARRHAAEATVSANESFKSELKGHLDVFYETKNKIEASTLSVHELAKRMRSQYPSLATKLTRAAEEIISPPTASELPYSFVISAEEKSSRISLEFAENLKFRDRVNEMLRLMTHLTKVEAVESEKQFESLIASLGTQIREFERLLHFEAAYKNALMANAESYGEIAAPVELGGFLTRFRIASVANDASTLERDSHPWYFYTAAGFLIGVALSMLIAILRVVLPIVVFGVDR